MHRKIVTAQLAEMLEPVWQESTVAQSRGYYFEEPPWTVVVWQSATEEGMWCWNVQHLAVIQVQGHSYTERLAKSESVTRWMKLSEYSDN